MVRIARTRTVPRASNLSHAAGKGLDNLLRAVYGDLLAGAHVGQRRLVVAAKAVFGRLAALHLARAGTFVSDAVASAVRRPAAVGARGGATGRLGAALDVGGVGGTCARDGGSAGRGAV